MNNYNYQNFRQFETNYMPNQNESYLNQNQPNYIPSQSTAPPGVGYVNENITYAEDILNKNKG